MTSLAFRWLCPGTRRSSEPSWTTTTPGTSHFGLSVAVSGDTVVVGADGNAAAAWVFVRSVRSWSQKAKLLPADGAHGDRFGTPLALSGDTVVVGASYDDDSGTNSGSAYVFLRDGTSWSEQTKLLASDGAQDDAFGSTVALSGGTAVVGANFDDDRGENSGSAYVFVLAPPTPTERITGLLQDVEVLLSAGLLSLGEVKLLSAKLEAATRQLRTTPSTAIGKLDAFIQQLNTFIVSGALSAENGQPLIDEANEIIDQIMFD